MISFDPSLPLKTIGQSFQNESLPKARTKEPQNAQISK